MNYTSLLGDIKSRIQTAQTRTVFAVNAELVSLYWEVGQLLEQRQKVEGWVKGTLPRLAKDLHNDFPELKGFSERNLDRMVAFYREYPYASLISPTLVAKFTLRSVVARLIGQQPAGQIQMAEIPISMFAGEGT